MKQKSSKVSKDSKPHQYVVGIDEVGRGPIAGPVAVGAFVLLKPEEVRRRRIFRGVKESKQLSHESREEWFAIIEKARAEKLVDFSVAFQSNTIIDEAGISFAIRAALAETLEKFTAVHNFEPDQCLVLLDGGLKAPPHFKNQKTIIRGDAKESIIALASICAKVLRDRRMTAYARKYPAYGFEIHKGYGTKKHYAAIKKKGISALHRRTWIM